MSAPATPIMAHVTGLVTRDGLGLIRCERCRKQVDASDACVGTVVDGSVAGSVLLCSACAQNEAVRNWLVGYLQGPEAPASGCEPEADGWD